MEVEITIPKKKRHIILKVVLGLLIAIPIGFCILAAIPTVGFVHSMRQAGKEYQKKVDIFTNLPALEYERLVEISKKFHSEEFGSPYRHKSYTTNDVMISSGFDKRLPPEFVEFGIYKVTLWEDSIHGWLYYLFDSGGVVVVDWSDTNQTTVTYASTGSDYRLQVYPKED